MAIENDGLAISTTNVLLNVVPTITDPGTSEVAANISDPDHSLNYTCGTTVADFAVSYGAQTNISYVGISGHTAATPDQATIELYDDTLLIDTVTIQRNNNLMFTFAAQDFTDLIVKFITVPNNYQMTVSFIAAGEYLTIAKGQQAGFLRAWLTRHTRQRTISTLEVGPISSTQRSEAIPVSLSLPNEMTDFAEQAWQRLTDFIYEQPFFMKEVKSKPQSTCLCYDPKPLVKTHNQTLKLNVITLKFTAFNGLF